MPQICFKSLRTHTHGCQGCHKIINFVSNSKILIARSNWKIFVCGKKITINWLIIFFFQFLMFFNTGFWFYSMMGGWSTWQWVFSNSSQNFWSFDTPDTPGCASAVFADNQSENEIWNRSKQFLPVCNSGSFFLIVNILHCTLGGIASICFKFHFQTDYQQTLRTHTQVCQGCQKIRNFVRNSKILIARSTIQPKLSKIKNH